MKNASVVQKEKTGSLGASKLPVQSKDGTMVPALSFILEAFQFPDFRLILTSGSYSFLSISLGKIAPSYIHTSKLRDIVIASCSSTVN
jgi:hypothetical protein